MEVKEENNLIQDAFEIEADEIGFCLDQKWGDYENPYENSDTALAFDLFKKGWQAKSQAVPAEFEIGRLKDQITELLDERQDLYAQINAQAVPEGFVLVSLEQINQWGHMANYAQEYGCPECYEARGYAHSLSCEINGYLEPVIEAQEPADD